MKRVLPNATELVILAAVAVFCAIFASRLTPDDSFLAITVFPLFLVALVMGARRTWKPQPARQPIAKAKAEAPAK